MGWDYDSDKTLKSCAAALKRVSAALRAHDATVPPEWRIPDAFVDTVTAALARVGCSVLCAVPHPSAQPGNSIAVVLEADRRTVSTWDLGSGATASPVQLDRLDVSALLGGAVPCALAFTSASPTTLFVLDDAGSLWLLAPFVPHGEGAPAPTAHGPFCAAFSSGTVRRAALAVVSCSPITVVALCNGRVLRTLVSLSPLPILSSDDQPVFTEMDRVDDLAAGVDSNEPQGNDHHGGRPYVMMRDSSTLGSGCAVLASARDVLAVRADYVPDYAVRGTESRFVAAPHPLHIARVFAAPSGRTITAVTMCDSTLEITLNSGPRYTAALPLCSAGATLETEAARLGAAGAAALASVLAQLEEATTAYRTHKAQALRAVADAAAAAGTAAVEPALADVRARVATLHRQQAVCNARVAALLSAATPPDSPARPLADLCVAVAESADFSASSLDLTDSQTTVTTTD